MCARTLLFVTLTCLGAADAHAFVRVAGPQRASIRTLELAVALGDSSATYTLSGEVDASKRTLAVFVPVAGLVASSARAHPDAKGLAALRAATGPRLEEHAALDPCVSIEQTHAQIPKVSSADRAEPARRARTTVEVLGRDRANALPAWAEAHGVKLDPASAAALADRLRRGEQVLAVVHRLVKPGRGVRLPAVSWRAPLQPLRLGLAADQISPGHLLRVHLMTAAPGAVLRPANAEVVELPTKIALPEVALEDPEDLLRAAVLHTLRREDDGAALKVHQQPGLSLPAPLAKRLGLSDDAIPSRYAVQLGRGDDDRTLVLERGPMTLPHTTRWIFRRVWRRPLSCPAAPRYANIVRIQQRSEIMAMASLTGRKPAVILESSRARGYAQKADGSLAPVKIRRP